MLYRPPEYKSLFSVGGTRKALQRRWVFELGLGKNERKLGMWGLRHFRSPVRPEQCEPGHRDQGYGGEPWVPTTIV